MNFAGLVITIALIAVSATFGACIGRHRDRILPDPDVQAAIRNRAQAAQTRHTARLVIHAAEEITRHAAEGMPGLDMDERKEWPQ